MSSRDTPTPKARRIPGCGPMPDVVLRLEEQVSQASPQVVAEGFEAGTQA